MFTWIEPNDAVESLTEVIDAVHNEVPAGFVSTIEGTIAEIDPVTTATKILPSRQGRDTYV